MPADGKLIAVKDSAGTSTIVGTQLDDFVRQNYLANSPYIEAGVVILKGRNADGTPFSRYRRFAGQRSKTWKYTGQSTPESAMASKYKDMQAAVFTLDFDPAENVAMTGIRSETQDQPLFDQYGNLYANVVGTRAKALMNGAEIKWWIAARAAMVANKSSNEVVISDSELTGADTPGKAVAILQKVKKAIKDLKTKKTAYHETIPDSELLLFVSVDFRDQLNNMYGIMGRAPQYVQGTDDIIISGIRTRTDVMYLQQNITAGMFDEELTVDLSTVRGVLCIRDWVIGVGHGMEVFENRHFATNNRYVGGKMISAAKLWDVFKLYGFSFVSATLS